MMKKNIVKNVLSLYGLTIAKLVFPLVTLPYLTRVLSLDAYGTVSYVKNVISYIQIIIDFSFVVSGTKDIIQAKNDINIINKETSTIMFSRILLSSLAFIILLLMVVFIPILRNYKLYVILSFFTPFLSIFLFDFVFRGIEKMEVITIRFFIMKAISTVLTFVFVKNDGDIITIPILDIISSICAVCFALLELRKNNIFPFLEKFSFLDSINKIKDASTYFLSNVANVTFNSINTILIGIYLSAADIAYWSLCIQIVNSIQNMYNPIIDGLYPEMIKTREFRYVKKTLLLFMPIILAGCIFTFAISRHAMLLIGGPKYGNASMYLRLLIPVLLFGFPSMLFGWTTLGAIDKQKEVSLTLVYSALFQLFFIIVLILGNRYTLFTVVILRSLTEVVLCGSRVYYVLKYKKEFN